MKKLLLSLVAVVAFSSAQAGMVSTQAAYAEKTGDPLARQLQRPEVIELLESQGIDRNEAMARIERLTPSERQELALHLEDAPAGQGFVSTAIFLFAVLVVSDALGYTDLFPFVEGPN
ncbi:MAG: PA2779 family protein [Pseudomonadota bacterium]